MAVSAPPAPVVPAPRGTPEPTVDKRSRLRHKLDVKGMPYLYIAPFFLIFLVFGLFPLLYTGWMATTQWNRDIPGSSHTFVGLGNLTRIIHDEYFWNALRNTAAIGVLATVPQLLLAMWIAHLMHRKLRARTFFRMGVLVPNVTSVAPSGLSSRRSSGATSASSTGCSASSVSAMWTGRRAPGSPGWRWLS